MSVYDLYVESGPKHRKTMVHVPQLLGCVANGPTTADALDATPEAITSFLRLLSRHGDHVDPDAPIEATVVEHITKGAMLGEGMPYLTLPTDLVPLDDADIDRMLDRLGWINDELGAWSAAQSAEELDRTPERGRPAGRILLHVLGAQGSYLASAFGSAPGFGPIIRKAENGELPFDLAFDQSLRLCRELVAQASAEQRRAVRQMKGYVYTLHKAMRRMNEHAWEHLAELSRREGGPAL